MSYEPRKKLTPVFVNNTTQYSSITAIVDYSGDGVFHFASVYSGTSDAKQLKITIDGTVYGDLSVSSSSIGTGRSESYVIVPNTSLSETYPLRIENGNNSNSYYNIPFSSSLKVEVINPSTSGRVNKVFYSKYV